MKALFLIALFLFSFTSFAQKEVSLNIGYGLTGPEYSNLETGDNAHYVKTAGMGFTTSVFDYKIKLATGISMFNRTMNYYPHNARYLRVPLGVELTYGKWWSIMGSAGMYVNCLRGQQGNEIFFLNRFVLGWYGKLGPGYRLTPDCRLLLFINYNSDITKTAELNSWRISSPFYEEYYYKDLYLSLGVYYEL